MDLGLLPQFFHLAVGHHVGGDDRGVNLVAAALVVGHPVDIGAQGHHLGPVDRLVMAGGKAVPSVARWDGLKFTVSHFQSWKGMARIAKHIVA